MSLAIGLSPKCGAASYELYPSLVGAPELPHFLKPDDSSHPRVIDKGVSLVPRLSQKLDAALHELSPLLSAFLEHPQVL